MTTPQHRDTQLVAFALGAVAAAVLALAGAVVVVGAAILGALDGRWPTPPWILAHVLGSWWS